MQNFYTWYLKLNFDAAVFLVIILTDLVLRPTTHNSLNFLDR